MSGTILGTLQKLTNLIPLMTYKLGTIYFDLTDKEIEYR